MRKCEIRFKTWVRDFRSYLLVHGIPTICCRLLWVGQPSLALQLVFHVHPLLMASEVELKIKKCIKYLVILFLQKFIKPKSILMNYCWTTITFWLASSHSNVVKYLILRILIVRELGFHNLSFNILFEGVRFLCYLQKHDISDSRCFMTYLMKYSL